MKATVKEVVKETIKEVVNGTTNGTNPCTSDAPYYILAPLIMATSLAALLA